MPPSRAEPVIVAGAGIAGLTAALAFAARGFPVRVFERSPEFREIGAGLQLSPNATRILRRLGVLSDLISVAVRSDAVVLRDAATLRELGRVPLGDFAERRWGAPYLVAHRADLQQVLFAAVDRQDSIAVTTNAKVSDISGDPHGVIAKVDIASAVELVRGSMIVGADGVWSTLRTKIGFDGSSRFVGQIAWRRTLSANDPLTDVLQDQVVSAFLHPEIHLIAYPIRAGSEVNLVAFLPTRESMEQDWSAAATIDRLRVGLRQTDARLGALADDEGAWTAWPVHVAAETPSWVYGSHMALIGDAAHAMTPFAAQGAAMAIEDAYTLAEHVSHGAGDLAATLGAWEASRRPRVARVARRGWFNRVVWNASGAAAWGRNLALKLRSPERLAADLDWLYGWQP